MYQTPSFEIPAAVRELAERNVVQVKTAYDQFLGMLKQAQDQILSSHGAMTGSAIEVQSKALSFAQANIEANFRFASDVARARDVKEYLEIQTRYAQSQLETYAKQAQEIATLVSASAQKAQSKT